MPPLLADFTHARPCKPFCEKYLTLPQEIIESGELLEITKGIQAKNKLGCLAVKDLFGDFLKTLISNSVLR